MKEVLEATVNYNELIPLVKDYFREEENEEVIFNFSSKHDEDWAFSLEAGFSYEGFKLHTNPGLAEIAIGRQDIVEILKWHLAKQNKELIDFDFRVGELAIMYKTKLKLNQRR